MGTHEVATATAATLAPSALPGTRPAADLLLDHVESDVEAALPFSLFALERDDVLPYS